LLVSSHTLPSWCPTIRSTLFWIPRISILID
jgi:hypothetical protein